MCVGFAFSIMQLLLLGGGACEEDLVCSGSVDAPVTSDNRVRLIASFFWVSCSCVGVIRVLC